MNNNITEIIFILDRSGSMHGMEADTIGGFNSIIEKQRKAEGIALISTVLFDNTCEVVHDRVPLERIHPMTANDFKVGGCTALMDALGGAIHHIGMIHKYIRPEDVPEHTMFVIMTDGMENASCKYSAEKVRSMIKKEQEKYGWEFLFLAANIDAAETAARYGIDAKHSVNYHNDLVGAALSFDAIDAAITCARANMPLESDAWRAEVDRDYTARKKKR